MPPSLLRRTDGALLRRFDDLDENAGGADEDERPIVEILTAFDRVAYAAAAAAAALASLA